MVAFQQVLDRLNELFGNEDFTEAQKVSFLEALLRTLLDDDALVQQAQVNSAKQFAESPDFDDAVTGAVADNQGAHDKMADYFFTNAPGRVSLVADIAKMVLRGRHRRRNRVSHDRRVTALASGRRSESRARSQPSDVTDDRQRSSRSAHTPARADECLQRTAPRDPD